MNRLFAFLLLLVCLYEAHAAYCNHSCMKRRRTTIRCGWYGWSRCTRYSSYRGTCRSYCTNGKWSDFHEINKRTACTATCGDGTQTRVMKRTCVGKSQYGADCKGLSIKYETVDCNLKPCPVDGGWSDWSNWEEYDECTVLCGKGLVDQYRERECNNPLPAYEGAECVGASVENQTIPCNTHACGDMCPKNVVKYFPHPEQAERYYQCDNEVAKRKDCGGETTWDDTKKTCVGQEPAAAPEPESVCAGRATVGDETDCGVFYMCDGFGRKMQKAMNCPPGTKYSSQYQTCMHASLVQC